MSFVLSLGDTIQGHWQEDPVTGKVTPLVGPELDASLRDLEAVARGFDKLVRAGLQLWLS